MLPAPLHMLSPKSQPVSAAMHSVEENAGRCVQSELVPNDFRRKVDMRARLGGGTVG